MQGNTHITADMLAVTDRDLTDDSKATEAALAQAEQKKAAAAQEAYKQEVVAAENESNAHFNNDDLADTLDI